MANPNLEALKPLLLALDAASVSEPDIPMPSEIQEASDLAEVIRDATVAKTLAAVGLDPQSFEKLSVATDAARAAQSAWAVARDPSKNQDQAKLEEEGYALRATILESCRWNLRNDPIAKRTLSVISKGEGVPDLVQDLLDLGAVMERNAAAFAGDSSFDAVAATTRARDLSQKIGKVSSTAHLDTKQAEAKGLRDRAYTYLHSLVTAIREAGRYAYRDDPAMARKFSSTYRRRHRVAKVAPVAE